MVTKSIEVTKIFRFESAHNLPNYEGDCANLHGHSYKLEVTVRFNFTNKNWNNENPTTIAGIISGEKKKFLSKLFPLKSNLLNP